MSIYKGEEFYKKNIIAMHCVCLCSSGAAAIDAFADPRWIVRESAVVVAAVVVGGAIAALVVISGRAAAAAAGVRTVATSTRGVPGVLLGRL
jgi:hypothetical protein